MIFFMIRKTDDISLRKTNHDLNETFDHKMRKVLQNSMKRKLYRLRDSVNGKANFSFLNFFMREISLSLFF